MTQTPPPSPNSAVEASSPSDLANSWALVTGGSGRGGAAICRALHARGMSVVIHHTEKSVAEAERLQADLEAIRHGSTRLWCADFADPGLSVPAWIGTQGISVLVCNASAYHPGGFDQVADVSREVAIYITANAMILSALRPSSSVSAAPPTLRSVVAITDISVDRIPKGHVAYTTGKGALQSFILTLATDWAPYVRFNVVQPGTLPFPDNWTDDDRTRRIMETIPLGRVGSFEDLAGAVVYLALDATYVTGQVLAVDGGRSRHMH